MALLLYLHVRLGEPWNLLLICLLYAILLVALVGVVHALRTRRTPALRQRGGATLLFFALIPWFLLLLEQVLIEPFRHL